jgi:Domain of unknown function (DUF4203)
MKRDLDRLREAVSEPRGGSGIWKAPLIVVRDERSGRRAMTSHQIREDVYQSLAAANSFPPITASLPIIGALLGALILFFGRRLFWLCIAAVGFAAGVEVAPRLIHEPSPLLALTIALVLGFIGALLALFLQKVAIAIAGFFAGGKLAVAIAAAFFAQHTQYFGLTFLTGGIIGAILLLVVFDWALIVLSAVVGAHLIQNAIALPPTGAGILFVALAVIGVVVQAGSLRRTRTESLG